MGNILTLTVQWLERHMTRRKTPHGEVELLEDVLYAAETGDLAWLKYLNIYSKNGLSDLSCRKTGTTPLHVAAAHKHTHCVKYLLEIDANPSYQDGSGETPLHVAALVDAVDCVQLLLEEKSHPEIKDNWGRTPLLKAVVYNSCKAAAALLEANTNPNAQDSYGLSPLHVVSSYGQLLLLQKLITAGANVNLLNKDGRSPLAVAVNSGHCHIVHELVTLGASMCTPTATVINEAVSKLEKINLADKDSFFEKFRMADLVITARGYPVGFDEFELNCARLFSADLTNFLPIVRKLAFCTEKKKSGHQSHIQNPRHLEQMKKFLPPNNEVLLLEDLTRKRIRELLMNTGRNVVWACDRLDIAPMLKKLILLRDI